MEEGSRKTALVISAVVAAAGLAVASYYLVRLRSLNGQGSRPLRSVTEVLNECFVKMREIQDQLSELGPTITNPAAAQN